MPGVAGSAPRMGARAAASALGSETWWGSATMVVWSKAGQRTFYNVTVDLNVDPLRRMLKESFPGEDIQPRTTRDSISLNGRVSSKDVAERAVTVAAAFSRTEIILCWRR